MAPNLWTPLTHQGTPRCLSDTRLNKAAKLCSQLPYLLQNAAYLAETIGAAIEAVGADHVDLVVTDSGGGNKQAGDILMARYATL